MSASLTLACFIIMTSLGENGATVISSVCRVLLAKMQQTLTCFWLTCFVMMV